MDGKSRLGHDALRFLLDNCVEWEIVGRDAQNVEIEYKLFISPEPKRLVVPAWKFDSVTAKLHS